MKRRKAREWWLFMHHGVREILGTPSKCADKGCDYRAIRVREVFSRPRKKVKR